MMRMNERQIPPKILTSFIRRARCSGRRYHTTRDSICENLCCIFLNMKRDGCLSAWRNFALYPGYWNKCADAVASPTDIPHFCESDWNRSGNRQQSDEHTSNTSNAEDSRSRDNASRGGEDHNGSDSSRSGGNNKRNRERTNVAQNPINADTHYQNPSFLLSMSHTHTVQSARGCLSIQQGQDVRAITAQYKRLARRFHPDKWHMNTGCSQVDGARILQCIANAYTLLHQHRTQG